MKELNKENASAFQFASNKRAVARQVSEWVLAVESASLTDADQRNAIALLRCAIGKLCDMYGISHDESIYASLE
jgi:hypothetical protein